MNGDIPGHVGVIMDGSGRWAGRHGLPRAEGNRKGGEAVMETVRACAGRGVGALTLFSPSMEDRKGSPEETVFPAEMGGDALRRGLDELNALGVRVRHLGLREGLPDDVLRRFDLAAESTGANRGMQLCIAFNYGSRREIFDAALKVADGVASGGTRPSEVDEESIRAGLYAPELPDVDLLIRTGGERRLSDFMLWQCAYAELYFTDVLWPDFGRADLERALAAYRARERKFGAIRG